MRRQITPEFGFEAMAMHAPATQQKLRGIGLGAVRRKFPPEFVNRIDAVMTYTPLDEKALERIVDQQVEALERHIEQRLGERVFELNVTSEARAYLLRNGTSNEYGARELKRLILRQLTQPLAAMLSNGEIRPGEVVQVSSGDAGEPLRFEVVDS